jgi:hypothetical protein
VTEKEKKLEALLKLLKELQVLPESGWGSITIILQDNSIRNFEIKTSKKP